MQKDEFFVTGPNGIEIAFASTTKGLYACDALHSDPAVDAWAFINLADNRREEYTKRECRDAVLARRVQNIIMFPGDRAYDKIVNNNQLANCPMKRCDIAAAEQLFGKNIGSLKGKTAYRQGTPIVGQTEGVPPNIWERFQRTVLAINIMFMNKIPFLISISRGLHFGTVKVLKNQQIDTVGKALDNVVHLYWRRGFKGTECNTNPEFRPLQGSYAGTSFNLCTEDEHVPEIERYIRTTKDHTRCGYNLLPFERVPRIMLIRLVCNAVFWLNASPHSDGVSDMLSPRYLLTGQHLDYRKHIRLEFVHTCRLMRLTATEWNRERPCGAICMGPTGNEQGGHHFMSLATGWELSRN